MSIRGSAASYGLVLGCCLTSLAFGGGGNDGSLTQIRAWDGVSARPATGQLRQGAAVTPHRTLGGTPAGGVCSLTDCQLPDQGGHGAGGIIGVFSDTNTAVNAPAADNFVTSVTGSITEVCWWGFYFDIAAVADCGPGTGDSFTITYYLDNGKGVPDTVHGGPFAVTPAKVATGNIIPGAADDFTEFEYSATHPPVGAIAGVCYWIEITNSTTGDCVWAWETAPPGDGLSVQDSNSNGSYEYLTERNDYDLSWCLNIGLADPTGQCDLVIDPACGAGAGECFEANGTPGCNDEVCCTLTCLVDSFCCDSEWDASCVNTAEGVGCVFIGINCVQPPANCQYPDQGGHGDLGIIGSFSDANTNIGLAAAEDFVPESGGMITEVCWWGFYFDTTLVADCSPGTGDAFTITYYNDGGGVPGTNHAGPFNVTPTKAETGAIIPGAADDFVEFEYTATHNGVPVMGGECYWIEIRNNTSGNCFWVWSTAPPGDELSASGDGDGYQYLTDRNDYDMAVCVGIATTDAAPCELEIHPNCGEGAGPCEEPNGTPGCEDEICCSLVCLIDSFCCDTEWDASCVANAGPDGAGCVCIPSGATEGVPLPAADNFDSYANGMELTGVNGWGGWDDTAGAVAEVRSDQFLSAPNSIEINGPDDQVQQYLDAACEGQYTFTCQQYIPSSMVGIHYFILLNTYADSGTKNWSTQVQFQDTGSIV
ncbi:MAG: hypothetical protein ACYS0D_02055, partial [Planctomycetota bacterium]